MSGRYVKLRVIAADLEDVFADIARLHNQHRPDTRAGDVIQIWQGSRCVRAVARGAKHNEQGTISLDQSMRRRLDVKPNEEYEFQVKKGSFLDSICWAWTATDAMPRIAARLAVLSVALGCVGLILGIISLWPKN